MAKKKTLQKLAGGLKDPRKDFRLRPAPMPLRPTDPRSRFKESHSTAQQRKKAVPSDRKRIESQLGQDWQKKVFGDAERYKKANRTVRSVESQVDKKKQAISDLRSQEGKPGAVDQALEQRIASIEEDIGHMKAGHRLAYGTVQRGKHRFEHAAEKTFVSDQKNQAQKAAQKLGSSLSDNLKQSMNRPVYRNPNSSVNEKKRKQAIRKKLSSGAGVTY